VAWVTTTLPATATWSNISYGNGKFTAVAAGSTTAATSTDGVTWTLRATPYPATWTGLATYPTYAPTLKTIAGEYVGPIIANAYTVQGNEKCVTFNSTAAATITLPNAASYPCREITVRQIAAFAVTSPTSNVQPLTSLTAGTAILSGAGKYARLVSNGQFWVTVESN
jgi:hypothetical protein